VDCWLAPTSLRRCHKELIPSVFVYTFRLLNHTAPLAPLRQGGLPLHRKAEESLRGLINAPEYARGELLPDELTLANRLGVSRGTVRAAILRLVGEGCLERRAGVGTRVVQRSTESAISAWRSFSREMARQGIDVRLFRCALREVSAAAAVAAALRVPRGTLVQMLDRVRGWNDEPVLRSRSWFHPRVRFQKDQAFRQPLYDLVTEVSGLSANRASEALTATAATPHLAKDLKIRTGSPVLLRRHIVFDRQGRPLELAEVHYVSERFTLTLDLKRE
jgi:GntR family transcriptional regulator